MTIPAITPLPTPPTRTDRATFAARADAFFSALPTFAAEMNAAAATTDALLVPAQPWRNRIINGDFTVNQRGLGSQTSAGYGLFDRWFHNNLGSSKLVTPQAFGLGQTAVPGEPVAFVRTIATSVAGAGNFVAMQQRIENVRTFAGQTCRLSFWAKADAARPMAIDLAQVFGTGGSPSATVSGIGAQQFSLTTSWQQYTATIVVPSISGRTLGTNGDHSLELTLWFDAGSSWASRSASLPQQSGTFDIARVQLEPGSTDTGFEVRPPSAELELCQRYYVSGTIGAAAGSGANASYLGAIASLPVEMRATPTVSWTDLVGNAGRVTTAVGNNVSFSVGSISALSPRAIVCDAIAAAAPGNFFRALFTAGAEL